MVQQEEAQDTLDHRQVAIYLEVMTILQRITREVRIWPQEICTVALPVRAVLTLEGRLHKGLKGRLCKGLEDSLHKGLQESALDKWGTAQAKVAPWEILSTRQVLLPEDR